MAVKKKTQAKSPAKPDSSGVPGEQTVAVTVRLGPLDEHAHVQRHIDLRLSPLQRRTLRRIFNSANNRQVFNNVRATDDVKDNIASSGAGESVKASKITEQQLAEVFDLDHVIVAGSAKNTANTGQAASLSQIWSSEYAMVARVAETNDIREPCLGRIFHWGEDGSEIGGMIETYRDETVRGDVVRVRHDVDEVVFYVEAGHLLSNITP